MNSLLPPPVALRSWAMLSTSEQRAVRELTISAQQLEFAGPIDNAIALCLGDRLGDMAGVALCLDGEGIVGFMLLKRRASAPDWAAPGDAVITALRIDAHQQGRGLGTAALLALPAWVATHWPEVTSPSLLVDEENLAGLRSYQKAGFVLSQARTMGRIGWVRHLSRAIPPKAATDATPG